MGIEAITMDWIFGIIIFLSLAAKAALKRNARSAAIFLIVSTIPWLITLVLVSISFARSK